MDSNERASKCFKLRGLALAFERGELIPASDGLSPEEAREVSLYSAALLRRTADEWEAGS